jgi:hypothetical protein
MAEGITRRQAIGGAALRADMEAPSFCEQKEAKKLY